MNKSHRQDRILQLIRARQISTQEDLAAALRKMGISTTQVTLSRDIRELGLVKTPAGYALPAEAQPAGLGLAAVAREFLLDVRVAQNLVVLRTLPAHANVLASAIDRSGWPEPVGTVAGDDTVLVVASDKTAAEALRGKFRGLLK